MPKKPATRATRPKVVSTTKPRRSKKARRAAPVDGSRADPEVDALMSALEHPLKADLEAARALVLSASEDVHEGVKWNAPSFRTSDYFATLDLRSKDTVRFVFHTGAKVKDSRDKGVPVEDPEGLLEWLAKDRAFVTVGRGAALARNGPALQALVRAWIAQMGTFREPHDPTATRKIIAKKAKRAPGA
jgi:hypothetical protein